MLCARCNNKFSPDQKYFVLCRECYEEVGIYADPTSSKMWGAVSTLINTKLTHHDLKVLADSTAFCKFVSEVLVEKDIDTRREWLLQEANKVLKVKGVEYI